jgi:hypothetical protein
MRHSISRVSDLTDPSDFGVGMLWAQPRNLRGCPTTTLLHSEHPTAPHDRRHHGWVAQSAEQWTENFVAAILQSLAWLLRGLQNRGYARRKRQVAVCKAF